jgi:hypothetical protein
MTGNSHQKWRSRTAQQSQIQHIANRATTIAIEHTIFAAGNACQSPMQACQPQYANSAQYNTQRKHTQSMCTGLHNAPSLTIMCKIPSSILKDAQLMMMNLF